MENVLFFEMCTLRQEFSIRNHNKDKHSSVVQMSFDSNIKQMYPPFIENINTKLPFSIHF